MRARRTFSEHGIPLSLMDEGVGMRLRCQVDCVCSVTSGNVRSHEPALRMVLGRNIGPRDSSCTGLFRYQKWFCDVTISGNSCYGVPVCYQWSFCTGVVCTSLVKWSLANTVINRLSHKVSDTIDRGRRAFHLLHSIGSTGALVYCARCNWN